MKKCLVYLLALLFFTCDLGAVQTETQTPDPLASTAFDSILSSVPEDVRQLIPSDFLTGESSPVLDTVSFGFFSKTVSRVFCDLFPEASRTFLLFLGLLILSCMMRTVAETASSGDWKTVFSYCSALSLCGSVYSVTERLLTLAESFFTSLHLFVGKVFPALIGLLLAAGKITSGTVLGGLMNTALALLSSITNGFLFPLLQILFTFTLGSMMGTDLNLSSVTSFIKRLLTFFFGAVSLLFTILLSLQSLVSKSVDGLAVKGVKFAVGNLIPIVGNALSDALTTISGSIGVIRSSLGIAAVTVILLMLLAPITDILIYKWLFDLGAALATVLSLEKESRFLSEMSGVIGFFAALLAIVSSFFLISLAVLSGIVLA